MQVQEKNFSQEIPCISSYLLQLVILVDYPDTGAVCVSAGEQSTSPSASHQLHHVNFLPSLPTQELYVQVRENNWALNYRHKKWNVTYDL